MKGAPSPIASSSVPDSTFHNCERHEREKERDHTTQASTAPSTQSVRQCCPSTAVSETYTRRLRGCTTSTDRHPPTHPDNTRTTARWFAHLPSSFGRETPTATAACLREARSRRRCHCVLAAFGQFRHPVVVRGIQRVYDNTSNVNANARNNNRRQACALVVVPRSMRTTTVNCVVASLVWWVGGWLVG